MEELYNRSALHRKDIRAIGVVDTYLRPSYAYAYQRE
jgi:hypothetical protein